MKWGLVVFPGGDVEAEAYQAISRSVEADLQFLWYREADLSNVDAVLLPGGFTYGNYLRPGALARLAPIMNEIARFALAGKPVIGMDNGFQVLCEAGLLPGVLHINRSLRFYSGWTRVRVESEKSPLTAGLRTGDVLQIPVAHGAGNYFVDEPGLKRLEANEQIVLRYVGAEGEPTPESNPNGSLLNIAGICNERGNVVGIMPRPERAVEKLLGGEDGLRLFYSLRSWLAEKGVRN